MGLILLDKKNTFDVFALKSIHGYYLTVDEDGYVSANSKKIGNRQMFYYSFMKYQDQETKRWKKTISFRTCDNTYLMVERNGKVVADRKEIKLGKILWMEII